MAGIFEESFVEIRCLGRGTGSVGNDGDGRMCVFFGGRWDREGVGREGAALR